MAYSTKYSHHNNSSNSTLAIVSSVFFPHHPEATFINKRSFHLQTLPGAWVDDAIDDSEAETIENVHSHQTTQEISGNSHKEVVAQDEIGTNLHSQNDTGELTKEEEASDILPQQALIEEVLQQEESLQQEEVEEIEKELDQQVVHSKEESRPHIPQGQNIILLPDGSSSGNIDILKQAIDNLRKEKEKLEETDILVKKSIQIVAKRRLIATSRRHKSTELSDNDSDKNTIPNQDEDDVYIIISHDTQPTDEEMLAAGIEGWEWVSVY